MPKNILEATVVHREDVTDDLCKLWLRLDPKDKFKFKPGQYCTIGVDPDSTLWRPYSIVSAPHESYIELFVELVPPPHGNLTPLLWKLQDGDSVFVLPKAKGVFTLKHKEARNHVFVSTVTGVVPYVSILRDYRSGNYLYGNRFFVLHGASYQDELVYDKELEQMESHGTLELTCAFTVSRPDEPRNEGWLGEEGRVNTLVEKYLQQWFLDPKDTIVYACGHPGMIEDVNERLSPGGWRLEEERFFKQ